MINRTDPVISLQPLQHSFIAGNKMPGFALLIRYA